MSCHIYFPYNFLYFRKTLTLWKLMNRRLSMAFKIQSCYVFWALKITKFVWNIPLYRFPKCERCELFVSADMSLLSSNRHCLKIDEPSPFDGFQTTNVLSCSLSTEGHQICPKTRFCTRFENAKISKPFFFWYVFKITLFSFLPSLLLFCKFRIDKCSRLNFNRRKNKPHYKRIDRKSISTCASVFLPPNSFCNWEEVKQLANDWKKLFGRKHLLIFQKIV